jgi:single-strand DNA-binding protein
MFGDRGAKVLQYLVKGQQVAVSGEPNLREWQNKDGETKTSLEVRVNDLQLIGKRQDAAREPAQVPQQRSEPERQAPAKQADPFDGMDDDIPF